MIIVYPLLIIFVIALFTGFYLADGMGQIMVTPDIPEFTGPTQQHHWSLQEKRLELEDEQPLVLSPEEFDAFMTSYSLKPSLGYCLHRLRFEPGNDSGTFYLLGSGFFMRSLIVRVDVLKTDAGISYGSIHINSWPLPGTGFVNRLVKSLLHDFFRKDYPEIVDDYSSGGWQFDFDKNEITLTGSILKR